MNPSCLAAAVAASGRAGWCSMGSEGFGAGVQQQGAPRNGVGERTGVSSGCSIRSRGGNCWARPCRKPPDCSGDGAAGCPQSSMAAAPPALIGRWAMTVLGPLDLASIHNGLGLVPRDSVARLFPYTLSRSAMPKGTDVHLERRAAAEACRQAAVAAHRADCHLDLGGRRLWSAGAEDPSPRRPEPGMGGRQGRRHHPARPEENSLSDRPGLKLDYRGESQWRRLPVQGRPTGCSAAPAGPPFSSSEAMTVRRRRRVMQLCKRSDVRLLSSPSHAPNSAADPHASGQHLTARPNPCGCGLPGARGVCTRVYTSTPKKRTPRCRKVAPRPGSPRAFEVTGLHPPASATTCRKHSVVLIRGGRVRICPRCPLPTHPWHLEPRCQGRGAKSRSKLRHQGTQRADPSPPRFFSLPRFPSLQVYVRAQCC